MKIVTLFLALTLPLIRSAAQIFAPTLEIESSPTNTVTVMANSVSHLDTHVVLQTSFNLADTNWVNVQTNLYGGAGAVIFTNIPATNTSAFYRVKAY
jgi:hypothetical protein